MRTVSPFPSVQGTTVNGGTTGVDSFIVRSSRPSTWTYRKLTTSLAR